MFLHVPGELPRMGSGRSIRSLWYVIAPGEGGVSTAETVLG